MIPGSSKGVVLGLVREERVVTFDLVNLRKS